MLGRCRRRPAAARTEGECGGMYVTRPALTPPSSHKPVALRLSTETAAFTLNKSRPNYKARTQMQLQPSKALIILKVCENQAGATRKVAFRAWLRLWEALKCWGLEMFSTVTHRKWKFGKTLVSVKSAGLLSDVGRPISIMILQQLRRLRDHSGWSIHVQITVDRSISYRVNGRSDAISKLAGI